MSVLSEKTIIENIKKGDTQLFEEIVLLYGDKISRYLKKFLQDSEDVADIWQEVFIKAYINIHSFEARHSFGSWLYRIAHNEALNHIRKKRPMSFTFAEIDPHIFPAIAKEDAHSESDTNLIKKILDGMLDTLEYKHREVLILFFYEELSYKEISSILRIPVSAVGVRISRAKSKILQSAQKDNTVEKIKKGL